MTIQDLGDVQERDGKFMVLVHVNPDEWRDTGWTREQYDNFRASYDIVRKWFERQVA